MDTATKSVVLSFTVDVNIVSNAELKYEVPKTEYCGSWTANGSKSEPVDKLV